MKNVASLVFCVLLIAMGLWTCASEPNSQMSLAETSLTKQTTTLNDDQKYVFEEGQNWESYGIGGIYGYIVYDNEGNELFRSDYGIPGFTMIGETLLRTDISGGSGVCDTRLFDIDRGMYSPLYRNVLAIGYGQVVYLDFSSDDWPERNISLVVHDIFNPEQNHNSFRRDFRMNAWEDPFLVTVEFLGKNQLFIEYYNSQDELVKETLVSK